MSSRTPTRVRFKARLLRPAKPADADWAFLVLPQAASNELPSRSQVSVEGTFGTAPCRPRSSRMDKAATG